MFLLCFNKKRIIIFFSLVILAGSGYVYEQRIKNYFFKIISHYENLDLTIFGSINITDSITSQPIRVGNILDRHVKYNYVTSSLVKAHLPKDILKKISYSTGKVILYEDVFPFDPKNNEMHFHEYNKMLNRSHLSSDQHIKIAYTMTEGTAIAINWVNIINASFDMVVVPDPFLVDVYKNSGVTKPIFILPLSMDIPSKISKSNPHNEGNFVFGNFSSTQNRKNQIRLVEAFEIVNKKRPNTYLIMNSRNIEHEDTQNQIFDYVNKNVIKNIQFMTNRLSPKNYNQLFQRIDAFVYPSKGEGFALQPREAMSMGIPVIITNNTAQKTICDSKLVSCVKSEIERSAIYNFFPPFILGNNFDCKAEDLAEAMIDMYDNYQKYKEKSNQMREWVIKHYSNDGLRAKYINLVKPKKIIYGERNEITDDYLMTNSTELYNKYLTIYN